MSLGNPDAALWLSRSGDEGSQQVAEHGAQVIAPVETELHPGEVAPAVLGELDGVVRAGLSRLLL